MTPSPSNNEVRAIDRLGPSLGLLSLRIWLGLRALVTGVEKFAGRQIVEKPLLDEFGEPDISGAVVEVPEKVYGFAHYHGVPETLMKQLQAEPLIPGFSLTLFDYALGPLLILLGITTLLGLFTRISLFAMGLIYSGLTIGLILLKQDGGIAWLGIHLGLIALALVFADRNRFFLGKKFGHL